MGTINCDSEIRADGTSAEWSIPPMAELERAAAHGGNISHARLGPFWAPLGETAANVYRWSRRHPMQIFAPTRSPTKSDMDTAIYDCAYRVVGMQVDLDNWRPDFWDRVNRMLDGAAAIEDRTGRPYVMEIDLIDRWLADHPECQAWDAAHNVQGETVGNPESFLHAPNARQVAFIRKAVRETCWANVTYQVSNEGFKGTSLTFETTVRDIIDDECLAAGCPDRPIGTNSHNLDIELRMDYAARHSAEPQASTSYPVWVNEYDDDGVSPDEWKARALRAHHLGTTYLAWRCMLSEQGYEELLDRMAEVVREITR
jgi:hypothetical protein